MIVTNPDGEEYIVKPDAFASKYEETDIQGLYEPIAQPIEYVIIAQDIVFKVPWGEDMFALRGSALNVSNLDKVYAIQNEAFKKTYTPSQVKQDTFGDG